MNHIMEAADQEFDKKAPKSAPIELSQAKKKASSKDKDADN